MPGPSPSSDAASAASPDPVPPELRILEVVRGMLVEVIGPEYLVGLDIDLDTAFDADLELESLEFVALAERLRGHYGEEVDFVAWLADLELDEIIALTVGDLVELIVSSQSSPSPPDTPPVRVP